MDTKRIASALTMAALTILLATSCEKYNITEGIYGKVIERYGDWMPWVGSNPPDHGERPIECEIYVYEYTRTSDFDQQYIGNYPISAMPKPLVATTTTNRKGRYQISLPPGEYSVFLLDDDGKLHANYGDEHGGLWPVKVEAGKVYELNLLLDHAVY